MRSVEELRVETRDALPSVRVWRSTNQAITASTTTPIQFDTVSSPYYNNWGMWSSGSNTRITIPVSGVWGFGAQIQYEPNSSGIRYLLIRKNGATFPISKPENNVGASLSTIIVGALETRLVKGDYLELAAFHTSSTSPLNVVSTADTSPIIWATLRSY